MSYEVMARRWRPQVFDAVAGQRHVTVTLANALRTGRLPHAILLAGPRGVGKTSIARILARSLNCDEGPTEKPCGTCPACTEIAGSTSLDVQEIDAASHTGVENVREIRDSVRYAAAPGKHRIFIIDEVHMLSQAAFNALLKTLEEPPPNSLFIFATTEPQKIPPTVLSRVQRFDLKRLGAGELFERIKQITSSEEIEIPEGVLRGIVREADGSVRDCLTMLDRLVSGFGPSISEEDARLVLDMVERRILLDILDPILDQDASAALVAVRRAFDKGVSATRLAADLLEEVRHHVVASVVKNPDELLPLADDEIADVCARAAKTDNEALQRIFRVLIMRTQDLSFAPRPEHVVEMAVVRLATLPSSEALTSLIAKLDTLGDGPGPDAGGGGSGGDGPRKRRAGPSTPPTRRRDGGGPSARAEAPAAPRAESHSVSSTPRAEVPAPPRLDPRSTARIKSEVKSHPLVREVIEALDAEIREIRTQDATSEPPLPRSEPS